jgi:hypothetical protein
MGTFDDIMSAARAIGSGVAVPVAVTTNQQGCEVSYATGSLGYVPARKLGNFFLPEKLTTSGASPLEYLFSDRSSALEEPAGSGPFAHTNPFSVDRADKLGLSISAGLLGGNHSAKFTLLSWDNGTFTVALTDGPGVLSGAGAGVGAGAPQAFYVISFGTPVAPPK